MWPLAFRRTLMCLSLPNSSERWERRPVMWGLEQGLRLWVCQQPVSMRYGIRGLTQKTRRGKRPHHHDQSLELLWENSLNKAY